MGLRLFIVMFVVTQMLFTAIACRASDDLGANSQALSDRLSALGYSTTTIENLKKSWPEKFRQMESYTDAQLAPVTLYRGLSTSLKDFDPSFQSKTFEDTFTSNKIGVALNYTHGNGTVIEYKIPAGDLKEFTGNYTPETIKSNIRIYTYSRIVVPTTGFS